MRRIAPKAEVHPASAFEGMGVRKSRMTPGFRPVRRPAVGAAAWRRIVASPDPPDGGASLRQQSLDEAFQSGLTEALQAFGA